jgi:hypothetical protein
VSAARRFNELARYADAIARLAQTAFEHVPDTKLAASLLNIDRAALVGKGGIARDNEQPLDARQPGNNVFNDTVNKILLARIAAHVLERKDGN